MHPSVLSDQSVTQLTAATNSMPFMHESRLPEFDDQFNLIVMFVTSAMFVDYAYYRIYYKRNCDVPSSAHFDLLFLFVGHLTNSCGESIRPSYQTGLKCTDKAHTPSVKARAPRHRQPQHPSLL